MSEQQDIIKRLGEAYQNYMQAIQWAWVPEDVKRRLEDAHKEYVDAVRQACADIDTANIDMNTLAAISQSMMAAAWVAAAYGIDTAKVSEAMPDETETPGESDRGRSASAAPEVSDASETSGDTEKGVEC